MNHGRCTVNGFLASRKTDLAWTHESVRRYIYVFIYHANMYVFTRPRHAPRVSLERSPGGYLPRPAHCRTDLPATRTKTSI